MSAVQVRCPTCQTLLRPTASLTPGCMIRCPSCQTAFKISLPAPRAHVQPPPRKQRPSVDPEARARWTAGVAGLAGVGAVAGATAARAVLRRTDDPDPYLGEDFGLIDADRSCVVTTHDGVDLAVREVGPSDAPVTVVFAHGFCLNMGAFHFQRRELALLWGDQVRMVFYDQRGHGKSGSAAPRTYAQGPEGANAVIPPWTTKGNKIAAGTFLGTKNNLPLVFKTVKLERMPH